MTINLADDATHALNRAAAGAARDQSDAIEPRHIFAGVISQNDPALARLLERMELDAEALPESVRTLPETYHGHLPFTADSHDVLAAAVDAASRSGQATSGIHLLQGVLAAGPAELRERLHAWGMSDDALDRAMREPGDEEDEDTPGQSAPGGAGVGVVVLLAGALLACGPAGSDGASDEALVLDPFAGAPADGPLPDIGPAPDGYRPTAASAPVTDIWLGRLEREDGDVMRVTGLRDVTSRAGYDNQPFFDSRGATLYYTSAVDSVQTETFRIDVGTGRTEQVTRTLDASEFSPTQIPGQDAFSAVREVRGRQYLWRYNLDGEPLGPIFATVEPVGYHAWADGHTAVMFVLGTPPTLRVGDVGSGEVRTVAQNPGRSIHRIPGTSDVSFVRKVSDDEWWIERLDPRSGESVRIARTLPGREDHAWTPQGQILMGDGRSLYSWSGGQGWMEVALSEGEWTGDISRIAVSPDGLSIALVLG